MRSFADRVIDWQRTQGRHDLPWQATRDPYRVWLSEIMLQQTQVATVLPYYRRFIERFPDVEALARADVDEVMAAWSGLGYYARARNLHACARRVVQRGGFPRGAAELEALPGIGRSTAAAIAAFCWNERSPILDGNVKRVLVRHLAVDGFPGAPAIERELWASATERLPAASAMPAYTQGLMDLGASICTRSKPRCAQCPVRGDCAALREGRVNELPVARPRRALAQRLAHLLLLVCGDRVLLQRRPATGVWGGLLAPPQFETLVELRRALPASTRRIERLPARRHVFTHFTLNFTPHVARIELPPVQAMEPGWVWLAAGEIDQAALPAPIKVLLREVMQGEQAATGLKDERWPDRRN
jgi:A/G-specific adenine glycosylase